MNLLYLVAMVVAIISPILGKLTIKIEPTGTVSWKTSVTITCGDSDGGVSSDDYDVLSGSDSLFQSSSAYSIESNDRVTTNQVDGSLQVIISDLMASDDGVSFKCGANKKGQSDSVTLSILEPPPVPENLAVVPSYTDAVVSFDTVSGADFYKVEFQAAGEVDFTIATEDLTTNEHTLTGLSVATSYTVRVSSLNDAGARDTITATFKTLDNRTPLIAEGVKLYRNWTDAYTKVAIILSWETANSAASSIPITKTKITMAKNGETDIIEKDGDIKTYTFESMSPSTKYEFTVALVNENGEGPAANSDMEVPAPTTKPPTVPPTEPIPVVTEPVKLSCDSIIGYTIGNNGTANIEPTNYGDDVTLSCSAQNGKGTEIEWMYEGIPYPDENKPGALIDGIKSTIKVTANEIYQGIYKCNIVGEQNTCSYTVVSPDIGASRDGGAQSMTSHFCLITTLIIFYLH